MNCTPGISGTSSEFISEGNDKMTKINAINNAVRFGSIAAAFVLFAPVAISALALATRIVA
jgi:hypothetical protein